MNGTLTPIGSVAGSLSGIGGLSSSLDAQRFERMAGLQP